MARLPDLTCPGADSRLHDHEVDEGCNKGRKEDDQRHKGQRLGCGSRQGVRHSHDSNDEHQGQAAAQYREVSVSNTTLMLSHLRVKFADVESSFLRQQVETADVTGARGVEAVLQNRFRLWREQPLEVSPCRGQDDEEGEEEKEQEGWAGTGLQNEVCEKGNEPEPKEGDLRLPRDFEKHGSRLPERLEFAAMILSLMANQVCEGH